MRSCNILTGETSRMNSTHTVTRRSTSHQLQCNNLHHFARRRRTLNRVRLAFVRTVRMYLLSVQSRPLTLIVHVTAQEYRTCHTGSAPTCASIALTQCQLSSANGHATLLWFTTRHNSFPVLIISCSSACRPLPRHMLLLPSAIEASSDDAFANALTVPPGETSTGALLQPRKITTVLLLLLLSRTYFCVL